MYALVRGRAVHGAAGEDHRLRRRADHARHGAAVRGRAGAMALGLRGDVLRLAIIQAALPQSITTFVFAKEYGLHADVLSTA